MPDKALRNDDKFVAHMVRQSRKRRNLKLSSDMYKAASSIAAPWIDNGGRNFSIDGTQLADTSILYSNILLAPSKYIVSLSVSSYVAGNLTVENTNSVSDTISADGDYQFEFTTFNDADLSLVSDLSFNGSVSFVSLKRIT